MNPSTSLTHREAVAYLGSAQKSNRGAAGYSRWVNRPLGRQLAAAAFTRGLSPNQVSLLSAACSMLAIAAIAVLRPNWFVAVFVVIGLVLGYALDSADGQLARLRGGGSTAGEWLDHVLDSLKIVSLHLAVTIAWFRFYHLSHRALLLVPLAFCAIASVFFFAIVLTDMLRRVARAKDGQSAVTTASLNPNEAAPILRSLIALPNDWGVLCLVMILLPRFGLFETIYGALLAINVLYLGVAAFRWFREMSAL
jgi:phosphatidylglycerophosphate synthase